MTIDTLHTILFPRRLGGHIALDFTNTAEARGTAHFQDSMQSYHHLLAWCWRVGLLPDAETRRLYQAAEPRPLQANRVHQLALDLREAIYAVFSSLIGGNAAHSSNLTLLNEMLRTAQPQRQLIAKEMGFSWTWNGDGDDLGQPLWPLTLAAAELLTSEQLPRLRKCPNCGWLFLDMSRNGTRRWCSMDFCGSQVKSRRQYERKKANSGSRME